MGPSWKNFSVFFNWPKSWIWRTLRHGSDIFCKCHQHNASKELNLKGISAPNLHSRVTKFLRSRWTLRWSYFDLLWNYFDLHNFQCSNNTIRFQQNKFVETKVGYKLINPEYSRIINTQMNLVLLLFFWCQGTTENFSNFAKKYPTYLDMRVIFVYFMDKTIANLEFLYILLSVRTKK